MLASITVPIRRLVVPACVVLLVVLGSSLPAAAAPAATVEQARQRYLQAKIRSWSQSVLKLQLVAVDSSILRGSGLALVAVGLSPACNGLHPHNSP